MLLNIAILAIVLLTAALLLSPRFTGSASWRATITPLASIIGSGFLVLGPILTQAYGRNAPLVMGALCFGASLFGNATRFNIAARNTPNADPDRAAMGLETIASWSLAFAFMISVAYYLNLFGAFALAAHFSAPQLTLAGRNPLERHSISTAD